jgi:hypothetical protein
MNLSCFASARVCRAFAVATFIASLSGCGVVEFLQDQPLISEMGILQSRKEHDRQLEQYDAATQSPPTGAKPPADIAH